MAADGLERRFPVQLHADFQLLLLFSPVDGQHLMVLKPGEGLGKVVVQPVDRVLLRGGAAAEEPAVPQKRPQLSAQVRIIGDLLSHNVRRAGQRVRRRLHALVRVQIAGRLLQRVRTVRLLGEQPLRQRRQTLLPGRGCAGAALLLIGAVQVLHLGQGRGSVNGPGQLLCKPPLLTDGFFHRLPAVPQSPQIDQPLLQHPKGGVIHGSVKLLAVTGNKGDGIPLIQQPHHIFHMLRLLLQFLRQLFNDRLHRTSSFPYKTPGRLPGRGPPA